MNNTGSPFMGRSEWDERAPKEQTVHVNRKLQAYLKIYTVVKIRTQIGTWHSVAQEIGNGILKPCTSLCLVLVRGGQRRWQSQCHIPQGAIKESDNIKKSAFSSHSHNRVSAVFLYYCKCREIWVKIRSGHCYCYFLHDCSKNRCSFWFLVFFLYVWIYYIQWCIYIDQSAIWGQWYCLDKIHHWVFCIKQPLPGFDNADFALHPVALLMRKKMSQGGLCLSQRKLYPCQSSWLQLSVIWHDWSWQKRQKREKNTIFLKDDASVSRQSHLAGTNISLHCYLSHRLLISLCGPSSVPPISL